MFLESYMLWAGNASPNNIGLTIVGYLYRRGIEKNDMGYACAVGVVLLLAIIFILAQHIILTNRAAKEAEDAYQQALNESGAQTQVVEVEPGFKVTSTTLREVIAPASKLIAYEYFYTDADQYDKFRLVPARATRTQG